MNLPAAFHPIGAATTGRGASLGLFHSLFHGGEAA